MVPKTAKECWKYKMVFSSSCVAPQKFVALAFHHNSNNFKGASARTGRYADVTLKARPASYRYSYHSRAVTARRAVEATAFHAKRPLTFSPLGVSGDELVDEGHVFKALPLGLAYDLRVAAFVGPKQVQVEHHLSTRTPPAESERERRLVEWARSRTDVSASRVARFRRFVLTGGKTRNRSSCATGDVV